MLWLDEMLRGRTQVLCDRLVSAEPGVRPPLAHLAAACDDVESAGVTPLCRHLLTSPLLLHLV